MKPPVQILGAGVIGLTTGVIFLEAGYNVNITAKAFTPYTTSDKAAAIWLPFEASPREKISKWSQKSYEVFSQLTERQETGVYFVDLIILEKALSGKWPWWSSLLPENAIKKTAHELLPVGYLSGFSARVPFIETPVYMEWLQSRFIELGGILVKGQVTDLKNWISIERININCTGMGAASLVNDQSLFPIQGQIVKLSEQADLPYISDEEGDNALAYVFPRSDGVILGGTAIYHEAGLTPKVNTTEDIIRRCNNLLDQKLKGRIIDAYVGIRPGRKTVCLEVDYERKLIHNYGHGGSGFTISWGCAYEVLELARELH